MAPPKLPHQQRQEKRETTLQHACEGVTNGEKVIQLKGIREGRGTRYAKKGRCIVFNVDFTLNNIYRILLFNLVSQYPVNTPLNRELTMYKC